MKCLEMTVVVIYRYINKLNLNTDRKWMNVFFTFTVFIEAVDTYMAAPKK